MKDLIMFTMLLTGLLLGTSTLALMTLPETSLFHAAIAALAN